MVDWEEASAPTYPPPHSAYVTRFFLASLPQDKSGGQHIKVSSDLYVVNHVPRMVMN